MEYNVYKDFFSLLPTKPLLKPPVEAVRIILPIKISLF